MGAAGSGIGRLGLKRELLACDDSLEKNPHGGRKRTSPYLRVVGGFFLYFFVNVDVDHWGCSTLTPL